MIEFYVDYSSIMSEKFMNSRNGKYFEMLMGRNLNANNKGQSLNQKRKISEMSIL